MADKLFNAISLSKKAGKLVTGFDAVCDSVAKGEANLVLFAQDVSAGTKKRMLTFLEGTCPVLELPYQQHELAVVTRKPVGVLAVADKGLATLCAKSAPLPPAQEKACCSPNVLKGGTAGKE